ncbi:predicted protein [Histoplasma capsulatum G186AR]|uniref:Uncharacterized protein n=1 Tax=Ajellomyces capsulatus (strain G186AR / H82 / ATCC MYA-2454 / RMSCC 2432) TaxID=447093 RepID=C0NQN5_AJECG|nr:uncharacterized protein HCBG_05315 [Histoplasma capsulatum G186AR]EEH05999.1 predicted protein [Histoplasma capsulatum G186AR]
MAARMQDQGPWQSLRRSLRLLLVASPNVSSRTNTPNQGNKLRKISPEVATPDKARQTTHLTSQLIFAGRLCFCEMSVIVRYENTLEPSGANYGEGQKYQQTERVRLRNISIKPGLYKNYENLKWFEGSCCWTFC